MNGDFVAAMLRAMQLTRAQDIAGAMIVIQTALAAQPAADRGHAEQEDITPPQRKHATPRLIDTHAEIVGASGTPEPSPSRPAAADRGGSGNLDAEDKWIFCLKAA